MADDKNRVRSNEANADLATPVMDLTAAAVIAAIAICLAIDSLLLPVPGGNIFTAPGLLPFLTSASLLAMAVVLGYSAIGRRRSMPRALDRFEIPTDALRSLTLGGIVVLYVLALQVIHFEAHFEIGSLHFVIGTFEPVSVVFLTGLLRLYWRAPLWACLSIIVVWIAFLSVVFRMLFQIPLP
jgi:Tripartite tricarboxylate transporter TctB family